MHKLALATIKSYQMFVSPYLPGMCRHVPSCSNYAYEAISKYRLWQGTWLAMRRVSRCHPWGTAGNDPLP